MSLLVGTACLVSRVLAYRQRAVVVGAGPAGATAAIYLARRGFSVDVYERRPEPQEDQARTFGACLSLCYCYQQQITRGVGEVTASSCNCLS